MEFQHPARSCHKGKYNLKELIISALPNSGDHLMMWCSNDPKAVVERKCLADSFTNTKILLLNWKQIKGPLDIPWMAAMRVALTRSFNQNIVAYFPRSTGKIFPLHQDDLEIEERFLGRWERLMLLSIHVELLLLHFSYSLPL